MREETTKSGSQQTMNCLTFGWVDRTAIINEIVELIRGTDYLEIYCGDESHFNKVQCARKVSVDIRQGLDQRNRSTWRMSSNQFFLQQSSRYDLILIDGDHQSQQVEMDLENAIQSLKPGGVVVCHDLNPTSHDMQAVPRIQREWTGDGWKAWIRLRKRRSDLQMLVVDIDYGVGLIFFGESPGVPLEHITEEKLSWEKFNENRRYWLHLLPPEEARRTVISKLSGIHNSAKHVELTSNLDEERQSTAIILYGLIHRSIEWVIEDFAENLVEPLSRSGEVDIFFHSWDISEIWNPRNEESGSLMEIRRVGQYLPKAIGKFESQEEFDLTIDWEQMFSFNPMRHCTASEVAAKATLMNFRRALESQKRAWKFFETNKTKSYRRVIVTRPDLRFSEKIVTPPRMSDCLRTQTGGLATSFVWVPSFHSWGGINDRFAIGGEAEMEIYCQRTEFTDGWLLNPRGGNPEWLLMKWLQRNQIGTAFLDFQFQRIRSNGQVAPMDRLLHRVQSGSRNDTLPGGEAGWDRSTVRGHKTFRGSPSPKAHTKTGLERFLILGRRSNESTRRLHHLLSPLGRVELILDRPEKEGQYYPDNYLTGFEGLMSQSSPFPLLTSWSRAMFHLAKTLTETEAIWFVEDDVAGSPAYFREFVSKTADRNPDLAAFNIHSRDEDQQWPHWHLGERWFEQPWRSFEPLCRISSRLISAALKFRETHGLFAFHEILFPSIAKFENMKCLDWISEPEFNSLLGAFRYRPLVESVLPGISHPVKNPRIHEIICTLDSVPQSPLCLSDDPSYIKLSSGPRLLS